MNTQGAGTKQRGKVYETASGEKRIRLVDIRKAKENREQVYEVSLADILLTGTTIEGPDDRIIRLKPINLKGLAALTKAYGNDLKTLANNNDIETVIRIATILANQDQPEDAHYTEDEIAQLLNIEILPIINELIMDLINPLFAPAEADMNNNPTTGA